MGERRGGFGLRGGRRRRSLGSESLILLCSLFFTVVQQWRFLACGSLQPRGSNGGLALSLFLVVTALHAFLLGLVVNRWTAKPLLTVLLLVTAVAAHYMNAYGVYLDADMLRNVLHTDSKESSELLTWSLLLPLLFTLLPVALLWRVRAVQAHAGARGAAAHRVPSGHGTGGRRRRADVVAGRLVADPQPSRSALSGDAGQLHRVAGERAADLAARAKARVAPGRHGCQANSQAPPAASRACWCWWWAKPCARRTGD